MILHLLVHIARFPSLYPLGRNTCNKRKGYDYDLLCFSPIALWICSEKPHVRVKKDICYILLKSKIGKRLFSFLSCIYNRLIIILFKNYVCSGIRTVIYQKFQVGQVGENICRPAKFTYIKNKNILIYGPLINIRIQGLIKSRIFCIL